MLSKIVKIKRLQQNAVLPMYATKHSVGMDFTLTEDSVVNSKEVKLLPTGIAMELPEWTYLDVRPRSGLSRQYPNYLANAPGTIDPDYRGEIKIMFVNNLEHPVLLEKGTRIAQGIIQPNYTDLPLIEAANLSQTERGDGGFGSTGK